MNIGELINTRRLQLKLTLEEVGNIVGVSKSTVKKWESGDISNMRRDKIALLAQALQLNPVSLITGEENPSSEVTLVSPANVYMRPIYNSAAAGFNVLAQDFVTGYMPTYISAPSEQEQYIWINVVGDSMSPLIDDGSKILIKKQTSVDSGSIAVILIDGEEAVVKKVVYGKDWIELQSINPYYPPRRFEGAEVERIKVVGIVKEVSKSLYWGSVMSNYLKLKNRVFKIIEADEGSDIASKIFDIFIITLIIINVASVIIDTFSVPKYITTILDYIEIISVIIFSLEYILRLWTANLLYPELGFIKSRLKYAFSFMAIIDLLAILPFYIPYIIPIDLRVLRALRIVRLLRMFKINRYTSALKSIATVFKNKSSELLSSMLVLIILMIISSVLMFNIESAAQPEAFDNAFSAFWWAIATLTTVGYGDIYPITIAGRVLSSIIALLGVALVAVPTGIISAGFMELIDNNKDNDDKKEYCPYCGKKIK